jgi:hypothetical protein
VVDEKSRSSLGAKLKEIFSALFSPSMKRSTLAFLVAFVLAFLSLGMTGIALFFLVTPALNVLFGLNIPMDHTGIDQLKGNRISGDAMWPTIILVSILWSFGFLIAGFLKQKTSISSLPKLARNFVYVLILWVWALFLWAIAIKVGFVN